MSKDEKLCEECNGSGQLEHTIITEGEFESDIMMICVYCEGKGIEK